MAIACKRSGCSSTQSDISWRILSFNKAWWNIHKIAVTASLAYTRSAKIHKPCYHTFKRLHKTQVNFVYHVWTTFPSCFFLRLVPQFLRLSQFTRTSIFRGLYNLFKNIKQADLQHFLSGIQYRQPHSGFKTSHIWNNFVRRIRFRPRYDWKTSKLYSRS